MLIEFRVANFQCFRDETILSLVPAAQDGTLRGNIWEGRRYQALKSAAIYGPNASGKTSLLNAFKVLRSFVVSSATQMTVGDTIQGIEPFLLSAENRSRPSRFQLLVELDGHGFRYRVEATRDRVWRENLERQDATEKSRWIPLIDRDAARTESEQTILHELLGAQARRDQIIEDTRENSLILSRAAERNVDLIIPLFLWFKQHMHDSQGGLAAMSAPILLRGIAELATKDEEYLRALAALVRDADTGIAALYTHSESFFDEPLRSLRDIEKIEVPDESEKKAGISPERLKALLNVLKSAARGAADGMRATEPQIAWAKFSTEHVGADGSAVPFDIAKESAGTLCYLSLAGQLLRHFKDSDLVVVDELDASLHPQLARRIVQLVHSPDFNSSGAQLLFSTHDVTLMDPNLMRRDQVFLTQKHADGASESYSLWDFEEMPRNNAAWAKNYLAGRFGGVPIFGPLLADIPQANEPTPLHSKAGVHSEAD